MNARFRVRVSNVASRRVSYVEEQAMKNLIEKFTANKSQLMEEFKRRDPKHTGNASLCTESIEAT